MRTPPPVGLSRDERHVYTANYEDGPVVVPGVTSILNALAKPFLVPWAKRLTAEAAIKNRATLDAWVETGGTDGAVELLTRASDTARDKAGDTGSEVHHIADAMNKGIPVTVTAEIEPYVRAYQAWVDRFQPKFLASEEMVYSSRGYAGTFDSIVEIAGEIWMLDIKTAAKGPFNETALQLAAYANGDFIGRTGDPTRYAIPRIEQFGVVKVRPEGAELYPFDVTNDEYEAFCAALRAYQWSRQRATKVIGQTVGPELLNFGKVQVA